QGGARQPMGLPKAIRLPASAYLTRKCPCIHGWIAQMNDRTLLGAAVTLNVTVLPWPLGPTKIESPGASKPTAPTFTSGIGGGPEAGGPSGFTPWDFAIAPHTEHFSTCASERGTCEDFTIDSVCASSETFVSVTVPPDLT